jgi:hypothetical protein
MTWTRRGLCIVWPDGSGSIEAALQRGAHKIFGLKTGSQIRAQGRIL